MKIKIERIEEEEEKYECIVSRAVTNIPRLLLLCRKCTHAHVKFLLYKGSSVEEELIGNYKYEVYQKERRNYVILREVVW